MVESAWRCRAGGGVNEAVENADVIGAGAGSADYQPICGLYTAGELAGGLFYFYYPGGSGLMSSTVFGKIVGASAGRAGKN